LSYQAYWTVELTCSETESAMVQSSTPESPETETFRQRCLPNELVDAILGFLKADDDLPALAAVVRTNQHMYDLAIPKLYETVPINERNKDTIGYGHTVDGRSVV
jgi:hypothetical protein